MASHQCLPTDDDLKTWLLLGGRGSGKTFAGSVWIDIMARELPGITLALVGPALHDVREVMVEGASGIKALAEPGDRPRWEAGRRRLVWKNQSAAYAFSAEDPDSLRGPQFHAAWADEFCAWRKPEMVLSNLRFGLRLGDEPLLAVTTTPRPIPALRRLMAEAGTVTERAATALNAQNLSPGFLAHLHDVYGGTRLAAQELEGLVVEGEGALFRIEDLKRARGARPVELERVVVAVDPPATAGGDACGIVVVGRKGRQAFVLADRTVRGLSPGGWAGAVCQAARDYGAHEVVAEGNQGGDMVRAVLRAAPVLRFWGAPIILEFLLGVGIASVWRAAPRRLGAWAVGLALVGFGLSLVVGYGGIDDVRALNDPWNGLRRVMVWGLPSALLVFGVVRMERTDAAPGRLERAAAFMGDASYSIYLVHVLVIRALGRLFESGMVAAPGDAVVVLTVVASLAAGVVVYLAVERPVLRLLTPSPRGRGLERPSA